MAARAAQAQEIQHALKTLRDLPKQDQSTPVPSVTIPSKAFDILLETLEALAQGKEVFLLSQMEEITTQQAANVLHVSRPFVVGLIERGELPARKVGTHRRLRLSDVLAYKKRDDLARQDAFQEYLEDSHALGLDVDHDPA
jgi:excisionase family DNA binding protein